MSNLIDRLSIVAAASFTAILLAGPAHASVITVPEPTTMSLLAAGAAAAAVAIRVRKRK